MRKSRRRFPTEEETLADLAELLSVSISHHSMLHGPDLTLDAEDMARAAMVFLAPSIRKALERARIEERARLKAGDNRSRKAESRKKAALALAARLRMARNLRGPRKDHQLAISVHKEQAQQESKKPKSEREIPPSVRTIRRYLSEEARQKK